MDERRRSHARRAQPIVTGAVAAALLGAGAVPSATATEQGPPVITSFTAASAVVQPGESASLSARTWNVHEIKHYGPHPPEYHDWVLRNMTRADEVADGDVEVFHDLFDRWVVQVVKADPTIVTKAYWMCRR